MNPRPTKKLWHPIPTGELKAARRRLGWSYERAARELGVSSKTYERYEKAGQVPLDLAADTIRALGLDMAHPIGASLRLVADLGNDGEVPTTSEVLVVIRRTAEAVEQLTVALRILADRYPGAPNGSLGSEEVAQPS